ncbi:MAG: tRNA uridine-5-carboxymethylaminomethyl(34) synthesis GTPase MnmE [Tissierellia bacterium]|nr:tRNA uridine-5-carboxymethylaminomethyl(34) synthesis GTPase MnmE [Tissierellia bacterium]
MNQQSPLMGGTIAAISTSLTPSGIGIVRMSGPEAFSIAKEVVVAREDFTAQEHSRRLIFGRVVDEEGPLDEVLAVAFHAPNSYTQEDMVELQVHGSPVVLEEILALLLRKGAVLAEPGEFTRRAYLNGRMDLTQAEAVMDLIESKNLLSSRQSMSQLKGGLLELIEEERRKLKDLLAGLVASIEFPTDEVEDIDETASLEAAEEVLRKLRELRDTADTGRMIKEGIKTAIIGKPNVGKSSLLNRLLRTDRAIVTEIPGTTRDTLEESYRMGSVSLILTDTAGIRTTDDVVEQAGIERSLKELKESDLILAVFDGSRPLEEEDRQILDMLGDKIAIALINKADLPQKWTMEELVDYIPRERIFSTNFTGPDSLQDLQDLVKELFLGGVLPEKMSPRITNLRQKQLLDEALDSLLAFIQGMEAGVYLDLLEVHLQDAYEKLGSITGMHVEDELMDHVFSAFCIGK